MAWSRWASRPRLPWPARPCRGPGRPSAWPPGPSSLLRRPSARNWPRLSGRSWRSRVAPSFFFSSAAACSGFRPCFSAAWLASLGDLPLGLGGLFQLFGGSGQLVDLVFQFLPFGVLGGLGLAWLAGGWIFSASWAAAFRFQGRFVLVGQGLGLFLLQEAIGGLLGLLLGLLQGGLNLRLGRRTEFIDLLGQFVLLGGQLVGDLGLQRFLLALLADLFLLS